MRISGFSPALAVFSAICWSIPEHCIRWENQEKKTQQSLLTSEEKVYRAIKTKETSRCHDPGPFSAGPKRGGLKSAGKRQESATFLQRSFFNAALQFFACCSAAFGKNDFHTAEKRMLQCNFCSAAFRELQRNFRFACGMLQGWGLGGWGLGLPESL